MSRYPEPKISGTLDIGAGPDPYADATVAVDEFQPMKPKRVPKKVGPIKLVISESAGPKLKNPPEMSRAKIDKHYRLKIDNSSRLRLYWVGNAVDLPDEWNGKFSKIKSRNALGALEASDFKEPFAVLKKGGKIYILANGPGEIMNSETPSEHVAHVVDSLKRAGFTRIEVHQFSNRFGDTSFEAVKPQVKKSTKRHHRKPRPSGLGRLR